MATDMFAVRLVSVQPDMYRFVASMLPFSPEDVDDVVQNANLDLLAKRESYSSNRPFLPFALAFAKTAVRTYILKKGRSRLVFDEGAMAKAIEMIAEESAISPDNLTTIKRLEICKSHLSERQKKLLDDRYGRKRPVQSIADELGKTSEAVRSALVYIRQRLAECMRSLCRMPDDVFERKFPDAFTDRLSQVIDGERRSKAGQAPGSFAEELAQTEGHLRTVVDQVGVDALLWRYSPAATATTAGMIVPSEGTWGAALPARRGSRWRRVAAIGSALFLSLLALAALTAAVGVALRESGVDEPGPADARLAETSTSRSTTPGAAAPAPDSTSSTDTQEKTTMKKSIRRMLVNLSAALMTAISPAVADESSPYVYSTDVSANGAEGTSVNIGYCMKSTSRIEVDFQYPEVPAKDVLFGAWGVPNSDATPGLRMAFWNSGGKFSFILDSDAYQNYSSSVILDSARHTAIIDVPNRAFRLLASDGSSEWSGSVGSGRNVSGDANWPVVLFGCAKGATGAGNQHTKARIYSVKIYETANGVETAIRDLVPCQKGDRAGFYDRVGGVFYGGQGTLGGIACGGDNVMTMQEDGYLETPSSNKTKEHITFNTGYCMKHNSRIEVDFQWLGTPADLLFGAWRPAAKLSTGFWVTSGKFAFLLNDDAYKSYDSGIAANNYRHTAIVDVKNGSFSLKNTSGFVEYGGSIAAGFTCNNDAIWPLVLFGNAVDADGNGEQFSYARIFSAKI